MTMTLELSDDEQVAVAVALGYLAKDRPRRREFLRDIAVRVPGGEACFEWVERWMREDHAPTR